MTPVQPLPAAEVRRRGDRMRRRRSIAAGGLAVAAVVAVASLGVATGGLPGKDDEQLAPAISPSTSTPSSSIPTVPTGSPRPERADLGPIDDSHLLDDTDLEPLAGTPWSVGQTIPGGVEPSFACDLSDEGVVLEAPWSPQGQVRHRVWHIEGTITLQQSVASFRTAQAAEKLVETVGGMLQHCEAPFVQDWTPETRNHLVGAANQSFVVDATWRNDVEEGGEAFADARSVVSVVRVGNRVSILALDGPIGTRGFDIGSPDTAETPVDALVEKVVERLSATP